MQTILNSQSFDDLNQLLNYVRLTIKDDYLIKALENTLDNGYKLIKNGDAINNLKSSLTNLQDEVIGLFKLGFVKNVNDFDLVLKNNDGFLKVVSLRPLGGLITTHINSDRGKLIMFEKGKTLLDLMDEPMELQKIINKLYL